jgi:hypothetical protein
MHGHPLLSAQFCTGDSSGSYYASACPKGEDHYGAIFCQAGTLLPVTCCFRLLLGWHHAQQGRTVANDLLSPLVMASRKSFVLPGGRELAG